MGDFTHLHVHSHFSLLDGLGKLDLLVQRAKELNMDSLAITDHGSMYGIIDFYKEAKGAGIKPIIGMEGYLAPKGHTQKRGKIDSNPRHITLLASNNEGYKNLMKLSTIAQLKGYYYKPRLDYDLLEQHHAGLIVLSGCLNGDIPKAISEKRPADAAQLIEWHLNLFGRDHFYLEVQDHPTLPEQKIVNEALFAYAKKYKLHTVATADSHYIHREDAEAQDVLVCVQTGKQVQDKDRLCMLNEDLSLKSPEIMKETWKDHPEVIDNTQKIAELCNVDLEFGVNKLPRFPLPPGITAEDALRLKCLEGLKTRYSTSPPDEAAGRLEYELEVIGKTGFAPYFLIVSDFVQEAKNRGILVGPGRGSAAGSYVSYLTNITNLDPLKYNLLFERFLNPQRISMPDIDLDFADDRRGEVIEYVREKYGHEHVTQIITFGTMAARAAIRDAGRALGFPYAFCDSLAKAIPAFTDFHEALAAGSELRTMYDTDPQAKKLIDTARKLEGVCRHASTHAAGVVITDKPLTEYVPLQLSTTSQSDETVTQYAMSAIEALGLLKMDFLGLKNLTIIQNALNIIKGRHDTVIDIDQLPEGDGPSYRLLQAGTTTGVFQLESSGMKRYLKELKPTEFEDIISILALYRPGPMDSIPDFIAAKHGRKVITYLHPLLKPILEKTYGVIVTQDQVLQIAREFSGFSYAEADILRKAVGKKIKELLDEQREKFIKGAIDNKGIDKNTAQKVWDFIEPFARYGFNRAHAACYAMIAYQTAYLKANYTAEFMAALLTSDEGDTDRQAIEVSEALSLNLKVLPPDINESYEHFTVVEAEDDQEAIRFGLGAIKNVGTGVVATIIAERTQRGKFKDLFDVFRRVNSKDLNRKSVESLARAGAFDNLSERNAVLQNIEGLLEFNRSLHRKQDLGQRGLFGAGGQELPEARVTLTAATPATKEERLGWEKELLGLYVSEHPLAEFHQDLQKITTPLSEIKPTMRGSVKVGGIIARLKKIITKSNKPMLFVTLEDMTGSCEALVFPTILEKTAELWVDGGLVIVEGKISDKDGQAKILADKIWSLRTDTIKEFVKMANNNPQTSQPGTRTLQIQLPPAISKEALEQLRQLLLTNHKDTNPLAVELIVSKDGNLVRLATPYRVTSAANLTAGLTPIVGTAAIRYN